MLPTRGKRVWGANGTESRTTATLPTNPRSGDARAGWTKELSGPTRKGVSRLPERRRGTKNRRASAYIWPLATPYTDAISHPPPLSGHPNPPSAKDAIPSRHWSALNVCHLIGGSNSPPPPPAIHTSLAGRCWIHSGPIRGHHLPGGDDAPPAHEFALRKPPRTSSPGLPDGEHRVPARDIPRP